MRSDTPSKQHLSKGGPKGEVEEKGSVWHRGLEGETARKAAELAAAQHRAGKGMHQAKLLATDTSRYGLGPVTSGTPPLFLIILGQQNIF